jgi:hypothetical protein
MSYDSEYRAALNIAEILILGNIERGEPVTPDLVEEAITQALLPRAHRNVDRAALRAEIERKVSILVAPPRLLEDSRDHVPWLDDRRAGIEWKFWRRYQRYMREVLGRGPQVVRGVDRATDVALSRLEDPIDTGRSWDRRGMVVANVQSGKTAHFTGLICKAVDAGYKRIVVLAGPHNNLRSQTQSRLDEEFLGFDTSWAREGTAATSRVGVGNFPGEPALPVISLTSRLENGDFKTTVAENIMMRAGNTPVVLVIKKYKSILENVLGFFSQEGEQHEGAPSPVVDGIPLLVIDDEADYASVDTAKGSVDAEGNPDPEHEPTQINALIRKLLITFGQRAYVGYTATPFANIFIHPEGATKECGPDLFPRNFILDLPPPTNYVGAAQVFGIDANGGEPVPLVTYVTDHAAIVPPDHKADLNIHSLPPSLISALKHFVVACAIRRIRGQETGHNSMLVHVTRYTNVQHQVKGLVEEAVLDIRERLFEGDAGRSPTIIEELRETWEKSFVPTSERMGLRDPAETWARVEAELKPAAGKITVREINGTANDVLDYKRHEGSGLTVVAIGGDKLSRGLTLEGLTISYYLRATTMYDTLMQMGRWFGYRDGYEDLCRVFTTPLLVEWYQHIARASEELREEFEEMEARGETPETYGLRVNAHPVMEVTSAAKSRSAETISYSYSKRMNQTTVLDIRPSVLKGNLEAAQRFLKLAGTGTDSGRGFYEWASVPWTTVAGFLREFVTHAHAFRADSARLASYIEEQAGDHGELLNWSVAVASQHRFIASSTKKGIGKQPPAELDLGGVHVVTEQRTPTGGKRGSHIVIGTLLSPDHESIGLSTETRRRWFESNGVPTPDPLPDRGPRMRKIRDPKDGLLVIYPLDHHLLNQEPPVVDWPATDHINTPVLGFMVSFPSSPTAREKLYTVNPVFLQEGWDEE